MNVEKFLELKKAVEEAGYSDEVKWAEEMKLCENADAFAAEYVWVVISSGMKNQIARQIYDRVMLAYGMGKAISSVFRNVKKVAAIENMLADRVRLFDEYQKAEDKVEWLFRLPFIGEITKWHLAKNLGMDVCKPDRHLMRIAVAKYGMTPKKMCETLAKETGLRVATVDQVIWRAANLGLV